MNGSQPFVERAAASHSRHVTWSLVLAGCFAIIWNIHRAQFQSITFDEANTFHHFIAPGWSSAWVASSNNHVLNTVLIHVFVSLLGLSQLTMRPPALFA